MKPLLKNPTDWIDRSDALHKMKRTKKAFHSLLPAPARFPTDWRIPYKLACYCAQLGKLKDARKWLELAFAVGEIQAIKLTALDDPDLEPLWQNIGKT